MLEAHDGDVLRTAGMLRAARSKDAPRWRQRVFPYTPAFSDRRHAMSAVYARARITLRRLRHTAVTPYTATSARGSAPRALLMGAIDSACLFAAFSPIFSFRAAAADDADAAYFATRRYRQPCHDLRFRRV